MHHKQRTLTQPKITVVTAIVDSKVQKPNIAIIWDHAFCPTFAKKYNNHTNEINYGG